LQNSESSDGPRENARRDADDSLTGDDASRCSGIPRQDRRHYAAFAPVTYPGPRRVVNRSCQPCGTDDDEEASQ